MLDIFINSFKLLVGIDLFLFWLFFIGIIIASLQDLKRREVDNWLNLFLLVTSFVFVFYEAVFSRDGEVIFLAGFTFVIMFLFMNLFYYGRVFAGGDAKLLVAMTVFFVGASFYMTLINIGVFLLFLMLSGSVYGLTYSFVLYYRDREKVNKEMCRFAKELRIKWCVLGSVFLMLFGFFDVVFFIIGALFFLLPLLFIFAKGLEEVIMIKEVSGKELREGDWLVEDIKIKGKVIEADWDGLSLDDIELLKGRKKVKIKEGLPFVPAFLIAFLGYVFLREWITGVFVGLF